MPSPCLDPDKSPYEKMMEAIEFAEHNRALVDQLIINEIPKMRREQELRRAHDRRMSPATEWELGVYAEMALADVPAFKNAVASERWGWRLALLYGQQCGIQEQVIGNSLLRQLINEISELRAEARRRAT